MKGKMKAYFTITKLKKTYNVKITKKLMLFNAFGSLVFWTFKFLCDILNSSTALEKTSKGPKRLNSITKASTVQMRFSFP